jgi:type IV secretion system protein VirB10
MSDLHDDEQPDRRGEDIDGREEVRAARARERAAMSGQMMSGDPKRVQAQKVLISCAGAVFIVGIGLVWFLKHSASEPVAPAQSAPKVAERPTTPGQLNPDLQQHGAASAPQASAAPINVQPDSAAEREARRQAEERALAAEKARLAAELEAEQRRKSSVFADDASLDGDKDSGESTGTSDAASAAAPTGSNRGGGRPVNDPNSAFQRSVEGQGVEVNKVRKFTNLACMIKPGRVIEGYLRPRAISDLPGILTIDVSRDVYGERGRIPLLPWGTTITARANPVTKAGQERNFIASAEAYLPNDEHIALDSGVADQLGSAGIDGDVDRHLGQVLGVGAVMALMGAGAATGGVNTGDQNNSISNYRQSVQSSLAQGAQQQLNGYANIPPTIKNDQGTRVRIMVEKVLDFSDTCATKRVAMDE